VTSPRRPPRWSKKTDELVRYVAVRCRPGLRSELGDWLEASSRFRDFITANQDKVRKKLTSSDDEESRLDVRSELLVAYLIVADRRFAIEFEAYGARRAGPDLSVTFRTNLRLNLEVTRLRARAGADEDPGVARLANVITSKLRQLPGEVPNALVITGRGVPLSEDSLAAATRLLKAHTDSKDDPFFERRGLRNSRDFHAQYLRLSGIFGLDEATTPRSIVFVANREARHPLPTEVVAGLSACFSSG
jgi:hypothetical protein